MEKSFNNFKHNGIHLTFPNGNSISTTWSKYSYSDNSNLEVKAPFEQFLQSNTCEIMLLKCGHKLAKKINKKFDGDGVVGYLTIDKWLEIINLLAKEKTELSTQPSQE